MDSWWINCERQMCNFRRGRYIINSTQLSSIASPLPQKKVYVLKVGWEEEAWSQDSAAAAADYSYVVVVELRRFYLLKFGPYSEKRQGNFFSLFEWQEVKCTEKETERLLLFFYCHWNQTAAMTRGKIRGLFGPCEQYRKSPSSWCANTPFFAYTRNYLAIFSRE